MKALVTGGTGFIGSKVVDLLVKNRHSVRLFSRKPELPARFVGQDVSLFYGNLKDPECVLDAMMGSDVFYHIGELRTTTRCAADQNVRLMERIVGRLRQSGIERIVFVSLITVAGIPARTPATEDTMPAAVFDDHYTAYKLECEKLLAKNLSRSEYAVIRPGVVYGPGSRYLGRLISLIKHIGPAGFPFPGKGKAVAPLIHVNDIARAVYLSGIRKEAGGRVFNLTDGCSNSWFDFFYAIARSLGKKFRIIPVPPAVLRPPALFLDLFTALFGVRLTLNAYLRYVTSDILFSNEMTRRHLGWKPEYDLEQGTEEMVREYRRN